MQTLEEEKKSSTLHKEHPHIQPFITHLIHKDGCE